MKDLSPLDKKLQKLEQQKTKIQEQLESLSKQKHERILEVLSYLPHGSVPLHTLIGGLIHVCKESQSNPKRAEEWQRAGQKFCSIKKSERASLLQQKK